MVKAVNALFRMRCQTVMCAQVSIMAVCVRFGAERAERLVLTGDGGTVLPA